MTDIGIGLTGILVGFLGTFGLIWFRAGSVVANVGHLQKALEDIKNNDLKHIHESMGRLFEFHDDTMKRCNVHGQGIAENRTFTKTLDGRLARLERNVNGEG